MISALEYFKIAAPNLMRPIPGVTGAPGITLPPNKQQMPTSFPSRPNIAPKLTTQSSSNLMAPPIAPAPAKVGSYNALAYFAQLGR